MKSKNFGKYSFQYSPKSIIQHQVQLYQNFLKKGLDRLFKEFSPIKDYSGQQFELYFKEAILGEPKTTEEGAKKINASYEAPLRVRCGLKIRESNEEREAEIYFTEFPLISSKGTFILNGVERVIVSQLIRSAGLLFTSSTSSRGRELFGASLIPERGTWLEFGTDQNSVMWVKIDRRRRVPATTLIRFFGIESDKELREKFGKEIENTIKKDTTKNKDEAILEIYKNLRPGDLITLDNAKSFVNDLFFNPSRYHLSEVGRWKIQQKFSQKGVEYTSDNNQFLEKEDIILTIQQIMEMNNDSSAEADSIDHLGNRRVRILSELLDSRLRIGMLRMQRVIKDRMSTVSVFNATPKNVVNSHPFSNQVKEFFTLSQLSQFMDNENPLAELEHKRRLSVMGPGGLNRERAGFEVRDVQSSHYGRICPIQTPEGQNVGLVTHLAQFATVNRLGFLETPYFKVKNGKVTDKVEYFNAFEEEKYVIAPASTPRDSNGKIKTGKIEARIKSKPGMVEAKDVDYMDVSPQQIVSMASGLIPFLEHDDANRALMGSNMQRQAVPCLGSEAPLVATGLEERVGRESRLVVTAENPGVVKEVGSSSVVIKEDKGKEKEYPLVNFVKSNQYTALHQKPIVKKGQKVKKEEILADGAGIDSGELSLGKNLLCAYMPFRGYNYEDAIIISERVAKKDCFTSVHIEDFTCDIRETKLGPETTTNDIPNVSEEKLKNLDNEGIIRVGAEVEAGDILIGKVAPKGEEELSPEELLLRKVFGEKAKDVKDVSLILPHGKRGKVIRTKIFEKGKDKLEAGVIKRIQVEIAYTRQVSVGDKLAGRHGNKGVISKMLPEQEMPFLEDGTPVDILLNPLSVASRMNLGQILETHLGFAAKKLGYQAIAPALDGPSEEEIKKELVNAGMPESGKTTVYDGESGLPLREPITVGYIYVMKLIHMVEDKVHMRAIGPYSLITQQPLGGKAQFGGQRFGEMEVWALEGYGAAHALQEMLTIKSDDVPGRAATYEAIVRGNEIKTPNIPSSFSVLISELKSLSLNVELVKEDSHQE